MADEVDNLALDKAVEQRVQTELIPLLQTVRDDRAKLRETWMRYYRIWSVKHDVQGYKGRTNTYVPAGRRWIENWTRRVVRDLFPETDWHATTARHRDAEPRAGGVNALLSYYFTKHMRLRRQATPWTRQLVMLGTSPARCVWRCEEREARVLRSLDEDLKGGARSERVAMKTEKVLDYIGPTFRPVDLFAWYFWPTTCADIDDAALAFEDLLVTRDRVKAMAEKTLPGGDPVYANTKKLFDMLDELSKGRGSKDGAGGEASDKFSAAVRRLADKGFTHPLDEKLPASMRPIDVTECRWIADLEDEGAKPYLVAIGHDEVVLRVQKEPFVHGGSWWLKGLFVEVLNEGYGRGLPELFDHMQYLANDLWNQTADALTWSVNPIVVMDMARVQDPASLRMVPGAKWLADPQGVQFSAAPQGPAQAGLSAVSQILGLADSYSNVTPVGALGAAQKGRSRSQTTAAGTQMMLAESAVDIKDVVENLQAAVFVPLMERSHSLSTQYLGDREIILKIAGIDGARLIETPISAADLVGDFDFDWLATAAQNTTIQATQAINFLGMVSKIPREDLQAQGIEIDLKYLLRSIYGAGGLGRRDADKVVRDTTKSEAMDPRLENDLFRVGRGGDLRVSPKEDHRLHIRAHETLGDDLPWLTQQQVKLHVEEHVQAMVMAEFQRLMAEQQQSLAAAGGMGPVVGNGNGGAPGGGGPGGRLPPPAGPGRMAQTSSLDDIYRQQPRGDAL